VNTIQTLVRLVAEELNMGICLEEKIQTLAWQVESPPWQRPCAWCIKSVRVPGLEFFTKMDYPLYSTDLAPCDFWLFPKLQNGLKGQWFADIPNIQCIVMLLQSIEEKDFQYKST
jgi:hypothetical protein